MKQHILKQTTLIWGRERAVVAEKLREATLPNEVEGTFFTSHELVQRPQVVQIEGLSQGTLMVYLPSIQWEVLHHTVPKVQTELQKNVPACVFFLVFCQVFSIQKHAGTKVVICQIQ